MKYTSLPLHASGVGFGDLLFVGTRNLKSLEFAIIWANHLLPFSNSSLFWTGNRKIYFE